MAVTMIQPTSNKADLLTALYITPGHTYKAALFTNLAALSASTAAYSTTNELVGTGYTAGGVALSGLAVSTSGTKGVLTCNDATWAALTGVNIRYCLVYDVTTGKAAFIVDFGANQSPVAELFTVHMPVADATTGLQRVA